jgi:hypothetical protein
MGRVRWFGLVSLFTLAIGCSTDLTARAANLTGIEKAARDYQKWTPANRQPFLVEEQIWALCRGITPDEQRLLEDKTHRGFIMVFVNGKGEAAMFNGKPFPVGTVIVKEKHAKKDSPTEACTVMLKREKGYNPACGDWEFAYLDAKGKATHEGKLKNCMECHVARKGADFTFRTYLAKKPGKPFVPWELMLPIR